MSSQNGKSYRDRRNNALFFLIGLFVRKAELGYITHQFNHLFPPYCSLALASFSERI